MAVESIDALADRGPVLAGGPATASVVSDVDVVVIGAGMSGLSAADHLRELGYRVIVFEAGLAAGGLARSISVGGEPIEAYYHHVFPQDHETLGLLDRLGLADQLEWHLGRMGVLGGDRVLPFDTLLDLLRFPLIPLQDRVRVGLATVVQLLRRDDTALDLRPAGADTKRWFGRRAYDVLWRPLLVAKFGHRHHDQVPMAWLVARIRQRAGARRAVGDRLGYLRGSLGRLVSAYVEELNARGVDIITSARVTSLGFMGQSWTVGVEQEGSQRTVRSRAVVAAIAAPVLLRLVDIPDRYRSRISSIEYRGGSSASSWSSTDRLATTTG